MPDLTPKLGIKKPLGNETVSRAAFNENWDIIDTQAQKNIAQGATAPASPAEADLWIDTSTSPNALKRYTAGNWVKIGAVTPGDLGAVANAGSVPSIQAGPDASKPAPGTAGQLYVATDTQIIYRDTGSAWQKVGAVKWNDIDGKPSAFTPALHGNEAHDPDLALASDLAAHLAETVIKANKTIKVPADYSTIQAALDSLKYAWIPRDVIVTIQIAAGTYIHDSPIVVDHPCGSQIQIEGAEPIQTTITGLGTVTGSAGNWSVPIILTNADGIQVGQYAIIRDTIGTEDHFAHRGVWEITAVNGNTITIKNTHRASTFPTTTLTGGNFIVLPTILRFSNCHGIVCNKHALGLLDKVAVVGTGVTVTIGICTGFSDDEELKGGIIKCGHFVGVNNFRVGLRADGASNITAGYVASCNNTFAGISALYGGSIAAAYAIANGNGPYGFYAQNSGSIIALSSTASGNGNCGFYALSSGSIMASSSTASGNGVADYNAEKMGYINCASYQGSPVFSPQLNTEGNLNAIITA